MSDRTIRVTLFKIPSPANVQAALEIYKDLAKSAVKDGKPYILSLHAGPTKDDQRNQGYTLVAKSEFASEADMWYYDTEDKAHQELKVKLKPLGLEGMMMVYYQPEVVSVL
ncbi:hypothetical protein LHYA1_G003647 [Lachnellula hyalina]|uniref:Stress-response A/B barrel domain-containing protein n=1 Tax=Lachnellula hyalina TaxID=1316788 RepID=A0A8H8R374_9HELO|nr:uncharacterized protein LHYA1_G003647 [Lachnellula hyalina]TVY27533.1 hypothetical protein LHYA1_G003647 [Lachnellula hyalina]